MGEDLLSIFLGALVSSPFKALVNLVLTLCDTGDSVVMFAPYYFNVYMSFQMTGVTNILAGSVIQRHFIPMQIFYFSDWLEKTLQETKPTPKLVTVVNPGNPFGTYIPLPFLKVVEDGDYDLTPVLIGNEKRPVHMHLHIVIGDAIVALNTSFQLGLT
ncbi:hypothetical protein ACSBR2_001749 [Camellia fascicularis]